MARVDAQVVRETQFQEDLKRLLEHPEIVERFSRLELAVIDEIVGEENEEVLLELCRYLKTLRQFRKGVAGFKAAREAAEMRRRRRENQDV